MHVPDAADVGVTIDVGRGLHVPVLRAVQSTPVRDLAAQLMAYRMTALRGTFRAADLTGATILLALHTDDDVTHAVPSSSPAPPARCPLPAARPNCSSTPPARSTQRTVVQLGLAYDHRIINGRDAVAFLRDLSALLQYPS